MKNRVPIEVSIYGFELNSFIGKSHILHWEDIEICSEKDYELIENQLKELLSNPLRECEYHNGDVKIINSITRSYFRSQRKLLSLFGRYRIKNMYEYQSSI